MHLHEEGVPALSIEGIERNKREEERRGNKAKGLPNHDRDQFLRYFSLRVLCLSFG